MMFVTLKIVNVNEISQIAWRLVSASHPVSVTLGPFKRTLD